jgi:hypothetical protein
MAVEQVTSRSRRQMLAAAVGGIGALVATAVHRPSRVSADTGDNLILGNDNTADTVTRLTTTDPVVGGAALELVAPGITTGLNIMAGTTGAAAEADVVGLQGTSLTDAMSAGVVGTTQEGIGVVGGAQGDFGAGVLGFGYNGMYGFGAIGTTGDADGGCGVQGWSGADFPPNPTTQTGVWAGASSGRTALQVNGRAKFTRSGRTSIAANTSKKTISVPGGVFSSSFAFAVLNTSRSGIYVRAVVPSPSTDKITIYLNKAVGHSTSCAWMVLS